MIPVIGFIESEHFIAEIDQYSESINMSRVQRNYLLSYGWQLQEKNMQQMTAQPT